MNDIEKYISQTEYVPDLKVDVGYWISDSFYYGSDRSVSQDDWNNYWKNKQEALEKPSLELYEQYALSEDVEGHEDQLVTYYRSVLKASKKRYKSTKAGDVYYWLRPIVYKKGVNSINFPWYDTLEEARRFLETLTSDAQGLIYDDLDEGWQVAVYAENDKFHFIERDWEEDKPCWLVSGNRERISRMAEQTMERARKQVEFFIVSIGTDFWTKRNY